MHLIVDCPLLPVLQGGGNGKDALFKKRKNNHPFKSTVIPWIVNKYCVRIEEIQHN